MSPRIPLWLIAVSTLTGCASGPPPMQVMLPPPRLPPPNLMTECQVPPPPRSAMLGDLLSNHVQAMALLHQCRRDHSDLIEFMNNATRRNNETNEPPTQEQHR